MLIQPDTDEYLDVSKFSSKKILNLILYGNKTNNQTFGFYTINSSLTSRNESTTRSSQSGHYIINLRGKFETCPARTMDKHQCFQPDCIVDHHNIYIFRLDLY